MKPRRSRGGGGVRIIGGRLRGSKLAVPDAPGLRPTPERVRETVFNWLQPVIEGARCLDLFAGTGALGIEALSRGARMVQFVERDRALARALEANLERLHQSDGQVDCADALQFLAGPATGFDVVFLDPPFAHELWTPAANRLQQAGWLRSGAMIHVETAVGETPQLPAAWTLHRERKAGNVRYALYRRTAGDPLD